MKALSRVLLSVLLIPAMLCLMLVFAVFTEPGTRTVLAQLQRFLPLEIDHGSGSLGGRLSLHGLVYSADGVTLALRDVVAELAPGCLWRGELCFRQLRAAALDIRLSSDVAEAGEAPPVDTVRGESTYIEFPLPITASSLDLASLSVRWAGGEWRQGAMQGSVRVHRSSVEVARARIVEPQLTLQATDEIENPGPDALLLPVIDLPLILSVDELLLVKPVWDFYGTVQQQDEVSLRGEWRHTALRLDRLAVRAAALGDISLGGTLAFSGNWPLEAAATVTLSERLQRSQLLGRSVEVSAIGDFSALGLQLSSDGTVSMRAEAQIDLLDAALPYTAMVEADAARPLALASIAGVPTLFQDASVAFPVEFASSGTLRTQQFELVGEVNGLGYESLRVVAKGGHEQGQLSLFDLSIRDAEGGNELHANGAVSLSGDYAWTLALQSAGLDVPRIGEAVRGRVNGSLRLAGNMQGEQWQVQLADVALQGQVNGMPARIRGYTGLDSAWRVSASDLQAQLNGARLSLKSPGEQLGSSSLHLVVDDIGRWYSGGSGRFEADVEVSENRERLQIDGRLQGFRWSGLSLDRATLAGVYDAPAGHTFSLRTELHQLEIGGFAFTNLRLSAGSEAETQSIVLSTEGDVQGELSVAGAWRGDRWQGTLAPTQLRSPVGEWELTEPVAINGSREQERITLSGHCWRHRHARLCPSTLVLGSQGSGGVALDSDLQILSAILPSDLEVDGNAQLQFDAQWAPDKALEVSAKVHSEAVVVTQRFEDGQLASFGWDEADINMRYTPLGLYLDAGVLRGGHRVVGVELHLPPDRQQAIAGAVSISQLRLGALQPFVPALSVLAGELSGDIRLSGTVDSPRGFGRLSLTGGRAAIEGNPTQLEDLGLQLDVQGTGAKIRGRGVLGGGELALSGRVDIEPELRLALGIEGREQTILYPPTTELLISEALKLTVQKNLLELTGELTVLDGVLEIEALPQGSVAISPSVVEVNSEGEILAAELPFRQRINVKVHIEDRFRVTGDMLETRLGGDLRVQQRPGQPLQLFGNLNTTGGEFRAYQTRLEIKRGTVSFTGPPGNPSVNVRAERRIANNGVTVGVQVQGPVEEDLALEIYSEPSMSQTEAMSYLVRGRGIDAGAGLDGTSAALSMASGVVNRSELVAELNRIPGLSNIEFGAEGSDTDTAATVSGYLGERIYLSYGVGLYEPVNVLTTRFYLRSRLWLEVVSSIENSVDLYYSFDID